MRCVSFNGLCGLGSYETENAGVWPVPNAIQLLHWLTSYPSIREAHPCNDRDELNPGKQLEAHNL